MRAGSGARTADSLVWRVDTEQQQQQQQDALSESSSSSSTGSTGNSPASARTATSTGATSWARQRRHSHRHSPDTPATQVGFTVNASMDRTSPTRHSLDRSTAANANASTSTTTANHDHHHQHGQLKTRSAPMSPAQRHVKQRSSISHMGINGGMNGNGNGYPTPSPFSLRPNAKPLSSIGQRRQAGSPSVARVFAHTSGRLARALVVLGALLALWTIATRQPAKQSVVPTKLTTRWWDNGTATERAVLRPKPPMPPRPPPLKPPSKASHTLAQMSRLSSSFSKVSPPSWTAMVHVSDPAQADQLSSFVQSLLRQSVPPQSIVVMAPHDLALPALGSSDERISFDHYSDAESPAAAMLRAVSSVDSDHVLFGDNNLRRRPQSYVESLLRAAGTKEYGSAILTAGGVHLPLVPSDPAASCSHLPLDRTTPIQIPTQPALLQSATLATLDSNGIRNDLPLSAAIAAALWTKAAVPSVALPMASLLGKTTESLALTRDCQRVIDSLSGQERPLGALFRTRSSPFSADADHSIALLLSSLDELAELGPIACGLATSRDVKVYLFEDEEGGSDTATHDVLPCLLTVSPVSPRSGQISSAVVTETVSSLGPASIVLYSLEGKQTNAFDAALQDLDANFGPRRGSARRARAEMEVDDAPVVIALTKADFEAADWIGALPVEALRHWHTPRIDLSVVTNNRPKSFRRLLHSLRSAHYFGDDVPLVLNLEQTADRSTQDLAASLDWPHGGITLRHRIVLGGLMPAIVESWYPATNDSYGVLLEDDVEVSPAFYGWLKFSILQYRYGTPDMRALASRMFGVSLYQPRNVELRPEGRQPFDAHALFESMSLSPTLPYLSQVPCSWGAAYFPEHWREFHAYLSLRLSEVAMPISDTIVPDIKSNRWPRSWKKYFIELVYVRGYVMLYPNYAEFSSLSTNHVEKGTHIHSDDDLERRKALFEVPLRPIDASLLELPERKLPPWQTMPILDLWGALATDDEVVERGWQTLNQLATCETVPRVDGPVTHDAGELLCKRVYDRVDRLVEAQPLQPRQRPVAAAVRPGSQAPPPARAAAPVVGARSLDEREAAVSDGLSEAPDFARTGDDEVNLDEQGAAKLGATPDGGDASTSATDALPEQNDTGGDQHDVESDVEELANDESDGADSETDRAGSGSGFVRRRARRTNDRDDQVLGRDTTPSGDNRAFASQRMAVLRRRT